MSSDRPPFVLAFMADNQGCAHHRVAMPLASMVAAGVCDGILQMQIYPDPIVQAMRPDVVVWQRQVEDAQIDLIKRWRDLLPDALFVYELDDYLTEIPVASFHASFMPPDIDARLARVLPLCDRVTTTTPTLADWLRSNDAVDVRVVPNGLPQDRIKERVQRPTGKLRIGWAGGMSHTGDLELLRPAMAAIGDETVTWVFMGMQPEDPPVRVEFHDGVPVMMYLDAMAALDLDLVLAPLEDNAFNHAKSNLRILEAGAIGANVIAQDLPSYRTDSPPVFAFAITPDDWTACIREFLSTTAAERKRSADALRSWVGRKYTLEKLLPLRADAWLSANRWQPSLKRDGDQSRPVLSAIDATETLERLGFLHRLPQVKTGLEDACRKALSVGTGVLWLRPVTTMTEAGWNTLRAAIAAMPPEVASISMLASDGANAFPKVDQFQPTSFDDAAMLDQLTHEHLKGRRPVIVAPSGPVIWLSHTALAAIGIPDVAGCEGVEELAILDWSVRASARKYKHMQVADCFAVSLVPPAQPTQNLIMRIQGRGMANWLAESGEVLTPEERETLETGLLRRRWGGPRPGSAGFENDYTAWSALRAAKRSAIPLDHSVAISVRRFGELTRTATAWTIYLDEAVTLSERALSAFAHAIGEASSDVSVVYADHEIALPSGQRMPEFKTDFDRELFLAYDYVTPVCAVRADVVEDKVPSDRADLYRMILDVVLEKGARGFVHVPDVLGAIPADPAPENMALEALARQVAIRDVLGETVRVTAHKIGMGCLSVTRDWRFWCLGNPPKVSIIVPTLGSGRLIQPCVATILQHTRYPNYEVIVLQNGERAKPELLPATRDDPHVRIVRYDPEEPGFNWSRMNNWAIQHHITGGYVVTMNDDVCVSTKNWLDDMMGQTMQSDVGVVGARLIHPMGVVQHVGVICQTGIAGHLHKTLPNGAAGHLGRAILTHENSAVTGACMLFSREVFDRIGGFDESLSHNYGDTVFCLKVRNLGLRVVVEMAAELLHSEGTSRPAPDSLEGMQKLRDEGKALLTACPLRDPYWSPNLALGVVQDGAVPMLHGLDAKSLAWTDSRPLEGAKGVLLVNDPLGMKGCIIDVMSKGEVPFCADLSGFRLRLVSPNALNMRAWDMRRPEEVAVSLRALGIERIVLRSLVGLGDVAPPVETLRAFVSIKSWIPVTIDPTTEENIAPHSNSQFGQVDLNTWTEAYRQLIGPERVMEAAQ